MKRKEKIFGKKKKKKRKKSFFKNRFRLWTNDFVSKNEQRRPARSIGRRLPIQRHHAARRRRNRSSSSDGSRRLPLLRGES